MLWRPLAGPTACPRVRAGRPGVSAPCPPAGPSPHVGVGRGVSVGMAGDGRSGRLPRRAVAACPRSCAAYDVRDVLVGGDWNVELGKDNLGCVKQAALAEFLTFHKLQDGIGQTAPTPEWRHPAAGQRHQKRLDTIFVRSPAWRHAQLGSGGSDHIAVATMRDGRRPCA